MTRIYLIVILLVASAAGAATFSSWNGTTIGRSTGNMRAWNGKVFGNHSTTQIARINEFRTYSTAAGGGEPPAITYVNSTNFSAVSGTTDDALPALTTTTGNTIIVASHVYNGPPSSPVTSITDTAGNTYTRCGAVEGFSSSASQEMWVATNITGHASNVITIHRSAESGYPRISVAQYSGLATSGVCDASSTRNSTASSTTHTSNSTATTAQANELVVGYYLTLDSYGAWSATSPYNLRLDANGDDALVDRIVSSTGAYSITASTAITTTASVIVRTFKGAQ